MQKWIVTGISGSGRIELLEDLARYAYEHEKRVIVHDMGSMIREEFARLGSPMVDERILDVDSSLLRAVRASAFRAVQLRVEREEDVDAHLIGVHAMFRWKGRLIPGVSYRDILDVAPHGFINVVDDVNRVWETNKRNPKWDATTLPSFEETQDWMMEEELVTEVLAEVTDTPMYLVARNHRIPNLYDLFFTTKKKIYLSYPITAVRDANPELLEEIQGAILQKLERLFVVFNPLAIEDMTFAAQAVRDIEGLPDVLEQLTPRAQEVIKARTVERDFQFIDQADAIVVFYMTDKVSPGVLAEIYYAHRNQKPVFVAFPGKVSPFMETATTMIRPTPGELLDSLIEFSRA